MESVLITLISILCTILLLKLLYTLRSILPWRMNCWFCNNNFWMKFPERNKWTCPKCEQYNGFTKDGDYNKPLVPVSEQAIKSPRVFHRRPAQNGLCTMCNINQQLKVTQLANFVAMNERNYDEEIEAYRMLLEKAYTLCSPCKNAVQMKLHKEKETFLGSKLLEARTPEKKVQTYEIKNRKLQSFINKTSKFIAYILLILILLESYKKIIIHKNLPDTIINAIDIISKMLERIYDIAKVKTFMTFPSLEDYLSSIHFLYFDILPKYIDLGSKHINYFNILTQKALGGFVCLIQIIGHVWNLNKLKHALLIDLLWVTFIITSLGHKTVALNQTTTSLVKLLTVGAILFMYNKTKTKTVKTIPRVPASPKRMKDLTSSPTHVAEEDTSALDSDDDVSLSKFGLQDFTDSSNETIIKLNKLTNSRPCAPRGHNPLWTKPKLNSTFCANSVLSTSPGSVSEPVFTKPSFNKCQKLTKDESDSDLDESISSLCIGSPNKTKGKGSIFSLRKFTATPNFVAPTPLNRSRPLISPSKLGHSTSWVAGGYWGSEGEREIFNINGSRSSSQSSGFESQASSLTLRNVLSQPPSREQSICREPDRSSVLLDRFQNCNVNCFGNTQQPQLFSRVNSPVYPQMQCNGHVHIPQPRFAQQNVVHNVFSQPQYARDNLFKTPGGSGLIKLPNVKQFPAR